MSSDPFRRAGLAGIVDALNAEYVHRLEAETIDSWPELFTDPCRYFLTTREGWRKNYPAGLMTCISRGMLHDRIAALHRANIFEPQSYRHVTGRARVIEGGDDAILAETPFHVARIMQNGETSLFATGVYRDRIAAADGNWLFAEKTVICDSSRIDTLIAIPL